MRLAEMADSDMTGEEELLLSNMRRTDPTKSLEDVRALLRQQRDLRKRLAEGMDTEELQLLRTMRMDDPTKTLEEFRTLHLQRLSASRRQRGGVHGAAPQPQSTRSDWSSGRVDSPFAQYDRGGKYDKGTHASPALSEASGSTHIYSGTPVNLATPGGHTIGLTSTPTFNRRLGEINDLLRPGSWNQHAEAEAKRDPHQHVVQRHKEATVDHQAGAGVEEVDDAGGRQIHLTAVSA